MWCDGCVKPIAAGVLPVKGNGHLLDLDDVREYTAFRFLTGLGEMPDSREIGEFLCRFRGSNLAPL